MAQPGELPLLEQDCSKRIPREILMMAKPFMVDGQGTSRHYISILEFLLLGF